jgi:hypothetical protein
LEQREHVFEDRSKLTGFETRNLIAQRPDVFS